MVFFVYCVNEQCGPGVSLFFLNLSHFSGFVKVNFPVENISFFLVISLSVIQNSGLMLRN